MEAAQSLARQPEAMQLRYLQTLTEIAGEKSSTIVFPLPITLMDSVRRILESSADEHSDDDARH